MTTTFFPVKFVVEASEIGWRPGMFPKVFNYDPDGCGDRRWYMIATRESADFELQAVIYRSGIGVDAEYLHVLND